MSNQLSGLADRQQRLDQLVASAQRRAELRVLRAEVQRVEARLCEPVARGGQGEEDHPGQTSERFTTVEQALPALQRSLQALAARAAAASVEKGARRGEQVAALQQDDGAEDQLRQDVAALLGRLARVEEVQKFLEKIISKKV